MKIPEAYIADAIRTPIAKVTKDGTSVYTPMHPVDQVAQLIKKLTERNNLKPEDINDLKWGATTFIREQGLCMARLAALVGLSDEVPGAIVGRMGGSGLNAIVSAICECSLGLNDLVIAGGSEDMSLISLGADGYPEVKDLETLKRIQEKGVMVVEEVLPKSFLENHDFKTTLESAEIIAKKWNIKREELDKYAHDTHMRANNAWEKGYFNREVLPIETLRNGLFKKDNGVRADTTLEKLAKLKPIFQDGLTTPGNASPFSVGSAATLIANKSALSKHNLKPRARLIGYAVVGTNVEEQLTGPIFAIPKALKSASLDLNDIDLFQIGEAFASEVLATEKELNIPSERINVNGGQISLGHPPGATGVNVVITGLHELERRALNNEPNNKLLLVSLCIGFGQGIAAVFERV